MFHVCGSGSEYDQVDDCLASWQGIFWCNACPASPMSFIVPPAILYIFVWGLPYYWIVLVWWREWCEETKHETLYTYMVETRAGAKQWCEKNIGPIVGKRHAGPVGYMVAHFVSMIGFCSTAYLLWHSFFLHTLLLAFVLIKAIQNGSTYMFRIFAYRYVPEKVDAHRDVIEKID
jgi:hypothetical protein